MDYAIVIFLVLLSGLFSGLTLGLLSLDKSELKRKITLGNKKAKKVYSVRKRGNLLLCTLLLGNVAVNSTLAIFLGNIASGFVAGIVATGLIVVFGEIIPQATFSRYALEVGARTAWLVKIFIFVMFPICFPIAWILDKTLGEEMATIYSKKELMKIVEEHEGSKHSDVDGDEERIIKGALSYSDKKVEDVMTPRQAVFALEENVALDKKKLDEIRKEGFTRIPVYRENMDNVVGLLYAKDLINIKVGKKIKYVCHKGRTPIVSSETKLDVLLDKLIKSKNHLAFVQNKFGGFYGIVTLEDVIEEILKMEIVDETDKFPDMRKKIKKKSTKKTKA